MSSDTGKSSESRTKLMNSHKVMLVFAIIFLFLGFFGLLALSGAQTGSCYTSGLGSAIRSSTGDGEEDGHPTPTAEVLAEFFIFLFLCLGVGMVTYIFVVKKKAGQLLDAGEPKAALIVNGKKDITPEDIKQAEKDQLMFGLKDVGLPSGVISAGLEYLKKGGKKSGGKGSNSSNGKGSGNKKNSRKQNDDDNNDDDNNDDDGDDNN